jgi:ring-1,2-phenylacetyl-CoA epoxidase subunit PaaD
MVAVLNPTKLPFSRPSVEQVWAWLGDVPDPEIPVVSVVDLGIVRDVSWSREDPDLCLVTVTPTYSGCPATEVIGRQIREALVEHGVPRVRLQVQLSPPWTTDWLTEKAHQNLREYGIAPPIGMAVPPDNGLSASLVVLGQGPLSPMLTCPRCGSTNTEMISRFGSTPCKSLHRCADCLEPFDHFKCH